MTVTDGSGRAVGTLPAEDLSRGGLFVCSEGKLPPLFSRVRLKIPSLGDFATECEVVRHVLPQQAREWHMAPGYAVQFEGLSAGQRELLEHASQGVAFPGAAAPAPVVPDDSVAAGALAGFVTKQLDHYAFLGLKSSAGFEEVRARVREAKRALIAVLQRPLSPRQREQATAAQKRVQDAFDVLAYPQQRMEYDAHTGNFDGVAHCISAGVTVSELETARKRYLAAHPGAQTNGHIRYVSGLAYENSRSAKEALDSYAQSLKADPLNLKTHQRYWALKRKTPAG